MACVVVGMSGGVDSSVAAALLVDAGHKVIGVTLKLWPCAEPEHSSTPSGPWRSQHTSSDAPMRDARAVAQALGIPHTIIDAEEEFRTGVVEPALDELVAGRTPNPCVRCNERIKFGLLWRYALALGAERLATGHYASVVEEDGRLLLCRGADRAKDQSYFLATLTQSQLRAALFPLAQLTKEAVRGIAAAKGLPRVATAESQDLCFVDRDGLAGLLARKGQISEPGPILDEAGRHLGMHRGLARYTVGQRHGLGIAAAEPLVVLAIDARRNALIVGPRQLLATPGIRIRDTVWRIPPPVQPQRVLVRMRYRAPPVPATIDAAGAVRFDTPQPRPAPGQLCACYDPADERCLAAGWIAGPLATAPCQDEPSGG